MACSSPFITGQPLFYSKILPGAIKKISLFITLTFLLTAPPFCLPKASAQGWQWARAGVGTHCDAWGVAADPSGNVFGAGEILLDTGTISFGSIIDSPTIYSVVWVKYNSSGVPLWSDYTRGDYCWLNNISTDPAGNLIVYGIMMGFSTQIGPFTLTDTLAWYYTPATKYFIAKISPAGTILWAINDGRNIGTYSYLHLTDSPPVISDGGITTDRFGNIYITGYYHDSITIGAHTFFSSGGVDAYVAKYTPAGALVWANSIGGAGNDRGLGITVASTGNVYICGHTDSAGFTVGSSVISNPWSKPLAYIAEFSPSGTPLWAQAPGGPNGSFAIGLKSDNSGNVYMTGGFGDTSIAFGSTVLTRTHPAAVPKLAAYLVQYSSTGAATWCKTLGSPHKSAWAYSVDVAACGQVWVCGNYTDSLTIDTASLPAPAPYTDPVFIAGYSLTGGVLGYSSLHTGGDDQNGLACDPSGNVFVCSDIESYIVAGPDSIRDAGIGEFLYVAKYRNSPSIPDTIYRHCDSSICSSGTDSITITAPPGYISYYWNDGATDSFHTFYTAGTYWVYCTACGGSMLIDTFHFTDTLVLDTVITRYDTAVCVYSDSDPILILTAHFGGMHHIWSNGDTTLFDTITYPGIYWVSYHAHCALYIDTFVVSSLPTPPPITGSDSICAGDIVTLSDALSGGIWSSSNTAIATIGSASGIATGIAPGIDTIKYTGPDGCYTTRPETVLIPPCINAVSEAHLPSGQVDMFPVPVKNELTIKMNNLTYYSCTISNLLGQVLIVQDMTTLNTIVATNKLQPGLYYITFNGNGGILTRKFVKE